MHGQPRARPKSRQLIRVWQAGAGARVRGEWRQFRGLTQVDGCLTLQVTVIKIERVTFGAFLVGSPTAFGDGPRTGRVFTRRVRIASGRRLNQLSYLGSGSSPSAAAFTEATCAPRIH